MAGIELTLSVEGAAAVAAALRRLQAVGVDLRQPLTEAGEYVRSETVQRFQDSHGPDGAPWAALKPATLWGRVGGARRRHFTRSGAVRRPVARRMAGAKPLVDHGHLRNSITYVVGPESVAIGVGSDMEYAAIHQFGGEAGRKDHRVQIPARPYLGLNPQDELAILDIFSAHLRRATDAGA